MKKTLLQLTVISALVIALTTNLNAQWTRNTATGVTYLITGTDKVGIGTTAPSYKLDIKESANCNFRVQSITNGSANLILARSTDAKNSLVNYKTGTTDKWFTGCLGNNDFTILDELSNSIFSIIQTTKYIGIGTVAPKAALDVLGRSGVNDTVPVMQGIASYTGSKDVIGVYGKVTTTAAGYGFGVVGTANYAGVNGNGSTYGVIGIGGATGVEAEAIGISDTTTATGFLAHGVDAFGASGNESAGLLAVGGGGRYNYGVIGYCGPFYTNHDTDDTHKNWAGFFVGDLFGTRTFRLSDARLKNNIEPVVSSLEKLSRLQTATYNFRSDEFPQLNLPQGNQIGFIAENMETVFPELVKEARSPKIVGRDHKLISEPVTFKTVDYEGILPVVVSAINEQKQLTDQKAAQVDARISQLENEITQLKNMLAVKQGISVESGYLMQNVPNPAKGTTTINFYLPQNSKGVLQVTDVNGKIVKSFSAEGSGLQQVELNTASLSQGTYTYQLTIDGKVADSKNMVITK